MPRGGAGSTPDLLSTERWALRPSFWQWMSSGFRFLQSVSPGQRMRSAGGVLLGTVTPCPLSRRHHGAVAWTSLPVGCVLATRSGGVLFAPPASNLSFQGTAGKLRLPAVPSVAGP